MAKFKVGDRVKYDGSGSNAARPGAEATVERLEGEFIHLKWVRNGLDNRQMDGGYLPYQFELSEPVAVAPATATLTIEAGKYYKTRDGRKVGPMTNYPGSCGGRYPFESEGFIWQADGTNYDGVDSRHTLIAEWVDEPAPAEPIHVTLGIDMNPVVPQVGDPVLIKGTLAGITYSPRGTNYNIVFETLNRRVSLHFLEEDFILDDRDDGDCPCTAVNDNGPLPSGGDAGVAFDGIASWLRSLAVARAA